MEDTPKTGETANPKPLENNASQPSAPQPVVNTVDQAEVERLKKEAEQARMRANQLENELKKKKEAEEAAKLKQLEEQNEWKSVAEQERAKREALEQEREAEERAKTLSTAKQEIFKGFPAEVIEIAEETGLGLTEDTDEARAALKEKLDKINARVVKTSTPGPNNPQTPSPVAANRQELIKQAKYGNREARMKVISTIPAVQEMRRQAGFTE